MPANHTPIPIWIPRVLLLAGVYNLVFASWMIFFPLASLQINGYETVGPAPFFWQGIGMFVGLFGVGYTIAARNPLQHWLLILIGFLSKLLAATGALVGYLQGTFPLPAALFSIPNDFAWWLPFGAILWHIFRIQSDNPEGKFSNQDFQSAVGTIRSSTGATIAELSADRPLLLIFLRHAGCTFCREALSDLARDRLKIEQLGTRIGLVTLSDEAAILPLLEKQGLSDLPRFSDPEQRLYHAFELPQGTFFQIFQRKTIKRGLQAIRAGHGLGRIQGNWLRLPGTFLISQGQIVKAFRNQTSSDRPDYCEVAHLAHLPSDAT